MPHICAVVWRANDRGDESGIAADDAREMINPQLQFRALRRCKTHKNYARTDRHGSAPFVLG